MNVPEAMQIVVAGAADLLEVLEKLQACKDQIEESQAEVSPALDIINHDDLSEGWELSNQLKDEIVPLIEKASSARRLLLRSVGQ